MASRNGGGLVNSFCPECQSTFTRAVGICPHDDTELVPADDREDPYEGAVLEDRYRLESLLGAGGMGMVYRSTQLAVDRHVAVKILRNELDSNPQANARFTREAKSISSLRHPNIVQLIDFGRDPELEAWFLVMEYVEGRGLADLIEEGRLAWELALEVVYQVCGALLASHEDEMVHRDLKPDNLHLVPVADGTLQVKVLDFGIARCLEQTTQLTESGVICGTPAYMSPEQAEGGEIGPGTDIYALGICLYEMLTGRLPFAAESGLQLMLKHVTDKPAPIRGQLTEEAPVDRLQNLLDKMLAKDIADRPDSARQVRTEIEEIRQSIGQPLHRLAGDYNWERRLDEMVLPRVEATEEHEGKQASQLANRQTVDPLAMTAGTLDTLHLTFKKFDLADTNSYSIEDLQATEQRPHTPHRTTTAEVPDSQDLQDNPVAAPNDADTVESPAADESTDTVDTEAADQSTDTVGQSDNVATFSKKGLTQETSAQEDESALANNSQFLSLTAVALSLLTLLLGGIAIFLNTSNDSADGARAERSIEPAESSADPAATAPTSGASTDARSESAAASNKDAEAATQPDAGGDTGPTAEADTAGGVAAKGEDERPPADDEPETSAPSDEASGSPTNTAEATGSSERAGGGRPADESPDDAPSSSVDGDSSAPPADPADEETEEAPPADEGSRPAAEPPPDDDGSGGGDSLENMLNSGSLRSE